MPFHRACTLSRTQAGNFKAACRPLLINPRPLSSLLFIVISYKRELLSLIIEYASSLRRSVSQFVVVPTYTCEAPVGTKIQSFVSSFVSSHSPDLETGTLEEL